MLKKTSLGTLSLILLTTLFMGCGHDTLWEVLTYNPTLKVSVKPVTVNKPTPILVDIVQTTVPFQATPANPATVPFQPTPMPSVVPIFSPKPVTPLPQPTPNNPDSGCKLSPPAGIIASISGNNVTVKWNSVPNVGKYVLNYVNNSGKRLMAGETKNPPFNFIYNGTGCIDVQVQMSCIDAINNLSSFSSAKVCK